MSPLARAVLAAASLTAIAGCSHERYALPTTSFTPQSMTETTSATLPQPMMNASPSLNVSSEIMKACNLTLAAAKTPEDAPQFGFDESTLTISDFELLNQIGACVTTGPLRGRNLQLIGRTDAMGTTEYNMSLGARRASAVAGQLTQAGVKPGQMEETSRGELDATGHDPAGRQLDRRVDIMLK
jgi:outer membrane protein OmpA-like peptidoglycan-associated protein